mgnify:CR=1 FL=1
MKLKIKLIISTIIILIATILFSLSSYIKNIYNDVTFEQLIFSSDVIINGVKYCLPIIIVLTIFLASPYIIKLKKVTNIKIELKKVSKIIKLQILPIKNSIVYSIIVMLILCFYSLDSIGLLDYIISQNQSTSIFEDYYVNPNEIELIFPEKKQNLIYIYI